jgi:AcrR family transcriptional regulator
MGRPKNFSREGVLEKALPVFWSRGFADASLQDLEQATGVNKSGLYAEFKGKGDLFVQSLRYYLENIENNASARPRPIPEPPPVMNMVFPVSFISVLNDF